MVISDQPMTEAEWARERATVLDAEPPYEPRFGDGREELHPKAVDFPLLPQKQDTVEKPNKIRGK